MAAPSDPVVAISAPDVMKMPPPTQPDMPMPELLHDRSSWVFFYGRTCELRPAEDPIEMFGMCHIVG